MRPSLPRLVLATCLGGTLAAVLPAGGAPGSEPTPEPRDQSAPSVGLFDGLRQGALSVSAEGSGDGTMTVSVRNRSTRSLRVVLPPGLLASGVSGQFGGGGFGGGGFGGGGFGGGGGGFGGGGLGGGGLGGGGLGGGGMGGGLGGTGLGGGGVGGGQGLGAGTLPASTGMLMLGRLIMNHVGERSSWDYQSLVSSGGLGGGGIGAGPVGAGLGANAFGGVGGRGFRSVPAAGPGTALVLPGQTRRLATPLVSVSGPAAESGLAMPRQGERLVLDDVDAVGPVDPKVRAALRLLAEEHAPGTVAQLVLGHVASRLDWPTLARLSRDWAGPAEMALARRFVSRLDTATAGEDAADSRRIEFEATGNDDHAGQVASVLDGRRFLGLIARRGITAEPRGPSLALRLRFADRAVAVEIVATDDDGSAWRDAGSFSLATAREDSTARPAAEIVDDLADGVLRRIVRVHPVRQGPGKGPVAVRIENRSPLILHGLSLQVPATDGVEGSSTLLGIGLPPRKSATVGLSRDVARRLHPRDGLRVVAADLGGL